MKPSLPFSLKLAAPISTKPYSAASKFHHHLQPRSTNFSKKHHKVYRITRFWYSIAYNDVREELDSKRSRRNSDSDSKKSVQTHIAAYLDFDVSHQKFISSSRKRSLEDSRNKRGRVNNKSTGYRKKTNQVERNYAKTNGFVIPEEIKMEVKMNNENHIAPSTAKEEVKSSSNIIFARSGEFISLKTRALLVDKKIESGVHRYVSFTNKISNKTLRIDSRFVTKDPSFIDNKTMQSYSVGLDYLGWKPKIRTSSELDSKDSWTPPLKRRKVQVKEDFLSVNDDSQIYINSEDSSSSFCCNKKHNIEDSAQIGQKIIDSRSLLKLNLEIPSLDDTNSCYCSIPEEYTSVITSDEMEKSTRVFPTFLHRKLEESNSGNNSIATDTKTIENRDSIYQDWKFDPETEQRYQKSAKSVAKTMPENDRTETVSSSTTASASDSVTCSCKYFLGFSDAFSDCEVSQNNIAACVYSSDNNTGELGNAYKKYSGFQIQSCGFDKISYKQTRSVNIQALHLSMDQQEEEKEHKQPVRMGDLGYSKMYNSILGRDYKRISPERYDNYYGHSNQGTSWTSYNQGDEYNRSSKYANTLQRAQKVLSITKEDCFQLEISKPLDLKQAELHKERSDNVDGPDDRAV